MSEVCGKRDVRRSRRGRGELSGPGLEPDFHVPSGCPAAHGDGCRLRPARRPGSPAPFPGRLQAAGVPRVVVLPGPFFRVRMGEGN